MIIEAKLVDYNHIRYLEDGEWVHWYGGAFKKTPSYKGPIIYSLARHLLERGYAEDDYLDVTGPHVAKTISGHLKGLAAWTIHQPDSQPMRRVAYKTMPEGVR